jgi:hypothetical protein
MNCTKLSAIGKETYKMFRETIVRQLQEDEVRIRDDSWTPYGLMTHFLFHNGSPYFDLWSTLTQVNQCKHIILSNEMIETHVLSGRQRVSMEGLAKLKTISQIGLAFQRSNPSTFAFASKGHLRLEPQGGISLLSGSRPTVSNSAFGTRHQRWGR